MPRILDLRPCDNCNGPVNTLFQVVRFSVAVVNVAAVNELFGMNQFFQGKASAGLLENFTTFGDSGFTIAMDKPESKVLMTELYICQSCFLKPLDLQLLSERMHDRARRKEESEGVAASGDDGG